MHWRSPSHASSPLRLRPARALALLQKAPLQKAPLLLQKVLLQKAPLLKLLLLRLQKKAPLLLRLPARALLLKFRPLARALQLLLRPPAHPPASRWLLLLQRTCTAHGTQTSPACLPPKLPTWHRKSWR